MSRSKRLKVVLEQAERNENEAARDYQDASAAYQGEVQKLDELRQYYRDYEATFNSQVSPQRPQEIIRQRAFLNQLSEAQISQQHVISQRQDILSKKRDTWHQTYLKKKSLTEFIESLKMDEQKELDKKEEKLLDEWVLQSSHTSSNSKTMHTAS